MFVDAEKACIHAVPLFVPELGFMFLTSTINGR